MKEIINEVESALKQLLSKWMEIAAVKTRYKYNKKILTLLEKEIENNKEIRFMQLMYNIGIVGEEQDRFYEESKSTYKKITSKK